MIKIPEQARDYLKRCDKRKLSKIDWDEKDWEIFYDCLGFALWKIVRRKRKLAK